jgi:hypothetical protein
MNQDQLEAILKAAGAKVGTDGYHTLPEGATLTLYVAKDGASLNVPKVDAIKIEGDLVVAQTKKETFFVARSDVFGAGLEANKTSQPVRRAGFGG